MCERILWRFPEWWSLSLSGVAWLLLIAPVASERHHTIGAGRLGSWTLELFHWLLMVIAMMLPLVVDSIRITAARSLWTRRHRAILGFILGYLGVWLVVGAFVSVGVSVLRRHAWAEAMMAAGAFAVAAAWQVTSAKRRALRLCHRTLPIAPRGWRADRDCLRYGWMIGGGCFASCWALMAACALMGHSVLAMTCATLVGIGERYSMRPNQRVLAGALAAFAAICVGMALFSTL